jgi:hypothetical protein
MSGQRLSSKFTCIVSGVIYDDDEELDDTFVDDDTPDGIKIILPYTLITP